MSLDPEIRDSAYQFFIQEVIELLQIIEDNLLNLRHDRSTPQVHALMRAAHSIKGGAASLGLDGIKIIAHRLEDSFRALYSEKHEINLELEELLLQGYDCLRSPLLQQLQNGYYDESIAVAAAEPVFAQLEAILGDPNDLNAELPTSAELGVDIVQVVFSSDVADGINRLSNVLANPASNEVAGEIRAQAEVFAGLGELFNLPGFIKIAKTTIAALDAHYEYAQEIGFLALMDFQNAQQVVLAGDRTQGGKPSEELIALGQVELQTKSSLGIVETQDFNEPDALTTDAMDLAVLTSLDLTALNDAFGSLPELEEDYELLSMSEADELELYNLEIEDESIFVPDGAIALVEPSQLLATTNELVQISPEKLPLQVTDTVTLSNEIAKVEPNSALGVAQSSQPPQSMRVDLNRLERLNNLVGELVIQENGSLLHNQQLQATLAVILKRFAKFTELTESLQNWADREQNIGVNKNQRTNITPNQNLLDSSNPREDFSKVKPENTNNSSQLSPQLGAFDALEMDSYSNLYALVQTAVEEMAQIGESMRDMTLLSKQTEHTTRKKQQVLKQVRNDLLWSRMLPLSDLLNRFPRTLRDLSIQTGKQVNLKLVGANTLVDKAILEKLYDPLVHLLRNAIDHGIEASNLRTDWGKPTEGTIEIRAYHRGNQTYIEVRDDGKGIEIEKVRQKAVAMQLLSVEEAAVCSEKQLYECLFAPGFSTASQVSDLSGRGMGLDAVRLQVNGFKGNISITSEAGKGSVFTLRLPLTLSITRLLVFSLGSKLLAIPIDSLLEIVDLPKAQIHTVQNQRFYSWQDDLIPLYSSDLLSYGYTRKTEANSAFKPMTWDKSAKLILISHANDVIALEVDRLIAEQEFVIKPFGTAIAPPAYLYGCTILGDGSLVPVIDGSALITHCLQPERAENLLAASTRLELPSSSSMPTILVVDDSLNIRQTLSFTLSKAGYRVLQALDGKEALEVLKENSSIQAVFCDIEMPRMNGFEFLTHYRTEFSDRHLPVIMLTSRSGEKHRQLAMYLGAMAYLTKPYLEQELLRTLRQCLSKQLTPV